MKQKTKNNKRKPKGYKCTFQVYDPFKDHLKQLCNECSWKWITLWPRLEESSPYVTLLCQWFITAWQRMSPNMTVKVYSHHGTCGIIVKSLKMAAVSVGRWMHCLWRWKFYKKGKYIEWHWLVNVNNIWPILCINYMKLTVKYSQYTSGWGGGLEFRNTHSLDRYFLFSAVFN